MSTIGSTEDELIAPMHRGGVVLLLRAALAFFVFTVVVGILNGTDAVEFGHKTLMTHVHAGTLGWITLSVLAAAIWLFAEEDPPPGWRSAVPRILPGVATVTIGVYIVAFLTTTGPLRPASGSAALVVLALAFVWVFTQARHLPPSVPRLGVLTALATSVIGGTIGVLLGLELSGKGDLLPEGAYDAHPATMVVGFLVPIGMALAEWHLDPAGIGRPADTRGRIQVIALFVGGIVLMAGALADQPALIGLNLPCELIAVGLFLKRLAPALRKIDWGRGYQRGFALSSIFLVLDIALLIVLIARYKGEIDEAPIRLILALDHMMFIGVMTNALYGLLHVASGRPRTGPLDQVVTWGTNLGLVVFVLGLLGDVVWLKRLGAPVMGTAILIAIGAFAIRLGDMRRREHR